MTLLMTCSERRERVEESYPESKGDNSPSGGPWNLRKLQPHWHRTRREILKCNGGRKKKILAEY